MISGTGGASWSVGSLSTTSSVGRCASMVSPPCKTGVGGVGGLYS